MTDLTEARKEIDKIDETMAMLFVRRMELVDKVNEYKAANSLPVRDQSREKAVIEKHIITVPEKWQASYRSFMRSVFKISRNYQNEKRKDQQ